MAWPRVPSAVRRPAICIAVALCCGAFITAGQAHAQGFSGRINYIGGLGPIGSQRPLCLCVYTDAQLLDGTGCLITHQNPAVYGITSLDPGDYYLVAFVDVHPNEQLDPDEPYQIYRNRDVPPADPVSATSGATDIDFTFGDENVPGAATATPSAEPSSTPTPLAEPTSTQLPSQTASPTLSPLPSPSATGSVTPKPDDCNGDGAVTIDELVRGVSIALGTLDVGVCPAADLDHDGAVTVDELIRAVNAAV